MRLLDRIKLELQKKRFKTDPFTFKGKFEEGSNILILLPIKKKNFSLAIRPLFNLASYFTGELYLIGKREYASLLKPILRDFTYLEEKEVEEFPLDQIDIIWDLSEPREDKIVVPLKVKSKIRISREEELFPYFNVIVKRSNNGGLLGEMNYHETLNVPEFEFNLTFKNETRRVVWDFIIYKGHRDENVILFWDLDYRDEDLLLRLFNFFDGRITYLTPSSDLPGFIDIRPLDMEGILAALSLSHLYVGGDSLFIGPALFLGIPIITVDGFPLDPYKKWMFSKLDGEEFDEKLREIMS